MKFLLELRSCCGCATASEPPQEVVPLKSAGNGRHSPAASGRRRLTGVHSSTHWKPGLSAISEDGALSLSLSDADRKNGRTTARSEKKESVKTRTPAKRRYANHSDDYRRSSSAVALSAFSPTPFLF